MTPQARRDGLVVQELSGETLVYDLERHKAHCLNAMAARVWTLCDGTRSLEQIAGLVAPELQARDAEEVIQLALADLGKARLLRERPKRSAGVSSSSRREIVKRLGMATAFLPVVASILAPTAAEAVACTGVTGRATGCPCTAMTQCASGTCNGGTMTCA